MKVVLFCGGMGMRLREYSDTIPKPMVCVGYRPILWQLMKYYAHYGHKDFILCLGHKADFIKEYFINYKEYLSNDFTLSKGGKQVDLYNHDIEDWRITFADTGISSNIGQRLKAIEKYLEEEEAFLCNYSDGLTDFHLPKLIDFFYESNKTACFLSAKPNYSFHLIDSGSKGIVKSIKSSSKSDLWVNAGYFVFRKDIFKYMHDGEELVEQPFERLIEEGELATLRHEGFWMGMDTFKDKQQLEDIYQKGNSPWEVWKNSVVGGG